MKVVPFIDQDGYYIDGIAVGDDITGLTLHAEDRGQETMTIGYIAAYEIKAGLYKPRLDLKALEKDYGKYSWDAYPKSLTVEQVDKYWIEGLTQEEIDELNQPAPLSELDQLRHDMQEAQAEMWDFLLGGRA